MKTDVNKIMALKKGGWSTQDIATEMHLEEDEVKKIVADETEKHTGHSRRDEKKSKESNEAIHITAAQLQSIYEKAAAIGAKEAIKVYADERKKGEQKKADRRLHNTKLLLRNYHMLKEHAEKSVFSREQIKESAFDVLNNMMQGKDNDIIIDSIKKSATRTAVIVAHVKTMLDIYFTFCEKSQNRETELRRYNVLWDTYMAEPVLSAKEIAMKQNMSKTNVYADLHIAEERLSALFFGVDGMNRR